MFLSSRQKTGGKNGHNSKITHNLDSFSVRDRSGNRSFITKLTPNPMIERLWGRWQFVRQRSFSFFQKSAKITL